MKLYAIKSFNELRTFISFAGGKRDEQLILPLNSSLSVTLDKKEVIDLFTPREIRAQRGKLGDLVSKSAILTRFTNVLS